METETMTVNVDKDILEDFRNTAFSLFGKQKGSLGKAVSQAFEAWLREKKSRDAATRAIEIMNRYRINLQKFDRQEAHVR